MAYLALYRKWRPQTFSEVIGQKHIAIPLERAVEQGHLAHAYLFSGPRGTGKTTMAKILAKAVNCDHRHGPNPCNECEICKEITSGSCLDVFEIDAASNRGIDEIRALKESVRTLPVSCHKKVYIIDEVHMLSREAFNALLKTLEEPPSYVLFILATTEPEKIPLTILSRCQRYQFHRISVEDIKEHLLAIAGKENIPLTEDAARLIAVRSEGGLRDALSLLDQCSSGFEGDKLSAAVIYDMLGLTGKEQIMSIFSDIVHRNTGELLTKFYSILQAGREPETVLKNLLEYLRDLMICKIYPDSPELADYGDHLDQLKKEASELNDDYLEALFSSLQNAIQNIRNSSPKLSAEIELIHLTHIKGSKDIEGLNRRITLLEQEIEQLKKGRSVTIEPVTFQKVQPPVSIAPSQVSPPVSPITSVHGPEPPITSAKQSKKTVSQPEPAIREEKKKQPVRAVPGKNHEQKTVSANGSIIDPSKYAGIWKEVLNYFMASHRIDVFSCFQKSHLILVTDHRAVASAPQQFLVLAGNNPSYQKVVSAAFQKVLGKEITIHTVLAGSSEEAETKTLLASSAAQESAPPAASAHAADHQNEEFHKINKDEIPQKDLKNEALQEALKRFPNCDIYEKD